MVWDRCLSLLKPELALSRYVEAMSRDIEIQDQLNNVEDLESLRMSFIRLNLL